MEFNATFLVSAISFIVFTFIMNAIFYKPLTSIIEERENFINKAIDDAKNSENIASNLLKNKEETLEGLKKSAGFIRSELAKRINLRYTPELSFVIDDSLEYGAKIDSILKTIIKD